MIGMRRRIGFVVWSGFPLGRWASFINLGEEVEWGGGRHGAWCFLHRRDLCWLWRQLKLLMGDRSLILLKFILVSFSLNRFSCAVSLSLNHFRDLVEAFEYYFCM